MVSHKRCRKCREVKPASQFYRDQAKADGLCSWCQACKAGYESAFRAACRPDRPSSLRLARVDEPAIQSRRAVTSPELIEVIDRGARRADLAKLGGLKGAQELRRRIEAARRLKAESCGLEIDGAALEAALT